MPNWKMDFAIIATPIILKAGAVRALALQRTAAHIIPVLLAVLTPGVCSESKPGKQNSLGAWATD